MIKNRCYDDCSRYFTTVLARVHPSRCRVPTSDVFKDLHEHRERIKMQGKTVRNVRTWVVLDYRHPSSKEIFSSSGLTVFKNMITLLNTLAFETMSLFKIERETYLKSPLLNLITSGSIFSTGSGTRGLPFSRHWWSPARRTFFENECFYSLC